ncbi:hypothetical protein CYMTET_52305 [Cymbomonas tetramitiformis]|uniref:DEP domain-containing protein n=1 Tax=Cymbomonas tetramitiformis TaxID=36881 RepID=A0AAE0BJH6_9CHLO|nr:hypothetical protein CYMTET_52305 [Cymbomonas tetramitiformis]
MQTGLMLISHGTNLAGIKAGSSKSEDADTAQPAVTVFTTTTCPFCVRAKAALQDCDTDYQEINLSENLEALGKLKAFTGRSTVPQVFVGGELVGGADELDAIIKSGEFSRLIGETIGMPSLPVELSSALVASDGEAKTPVEETEASGVAPIGMSAQLEEVAQKLKAKDSGLEIITRYGVRQGVPWRAESRCFSGKAAVDALLGAGLATSRDEAIELGQQLEEQRLLHHVTHSMAFEDSPVSFYRFQADEAADRNLFNMAHVWRGPVRPGSQVGESLRKQMETLCDLYLTSDGRGVDYDGLAASEEFAKFVRATEELQRVDLFQVTQMATSEVCVPDAGIDIYI